MALRAFDVVGLVERFDETLLLVADLSGLQHVLHRASELLSSQPKPSWRPSLLFYSSSISS